MGIQVEFNPDLALRKFATIGRLKEECLPETLEKNRVYSFLKKDIRNYWILGEIPLRETEGDQKLSKPLASIKIIKVTHLLIENEPYTKGEYEVTEVFDSNDTQIKFDGYERIK